MTQPTSFRFYRTPALFFGKGMIDRCGETAAGFGTTALLVHGSGSLKQSGNLDKIISALKKSGISHKEVTVDGEPSPELVDQTVSSLKDGGIYIDVVIAIGGGSVVDAGKAISAMLVSDGSITEYLEVVGTKKPSGAKVPFIAIPTTAGTGSEASANAVLSRTGDKGFKRSLRHDNYVPDVAIVDPVLSISCPRTITAACGMDALTQLLESYVSTKASPFTDALIESALPGLGGTLIESTSDGSRDIEARGKMAYAAYVSGIALANAGLGVVHGLASSIGAYFAVPHGVVCGTLLAPATSENIRCLRERLPQSTALAKYSKAASILWGREFSSVDQGCGFLSEQLERLTEQLQIPDLSKYGVETKDIEKILKESGNKNNPVQLTHEEMKRLIYERIR